LRTADVTDQTTKRRWRARSPLELRDTYRGFGDGFSRAFELAVTPALFGLAGYGLDRWLGIVPVFTLVFSLWAVTALFIRTWYDYVERMKAHEATGPWARAAPRSGEYRTRAAPGPVPAPEPQPTAKTV
jgi:hypothetical protein